MRIGISNLGWDPADDDEVTEHLLAHGLDFIDVAPTKLFGTALAPTLADLHRVRSRWEGRGLPIVALQSLFFGSTGLNLFAGDAVRARMLDHLGRVAAIAQELGARCLVFGSPRQRDLGSLAIAEAEPNAVDFFRRAADRVAAHGLVLCLEPNAPADGCNFMTDLASTLRIVDAADHPAVRLNFDVGVLLAEATPPEETVARAASRIGHIHLSLPGLRPLGEAGAANAAFARALSQARPGARAAIEVLAPAGRAVADWLPQTLAFAVATYARPDTP